MTEAGEVSFLHLLQFGGLFFAELLFILQRGAQALTFSRCCRELRLASLELGACSQMQCFFFDDGFLQEFNLRFSPGKANTEFCRTAACEYERYDGACNAAG